VPFGMYPSRPKREFLAMSILGMVLVMEVAMLGERTRRCFGSRVWEYRPSLMGCTLVGLGVSFLALRFFSTTMAATMLGERTRQCLGRRVREYCSC
jgi:hypothetical protein